MNSNDEQAISAFFSIRFSFEPGPNVNDESDVHESKELSPRNSTEAGRQTDRNEENFENELPPISCSSDSYSNAINAIDSRAVIEQTSPSR
jgi:hypothetical protein